MTGRYLLAESPEAVAAALDLDAVAWFPPRYNIAPGQPILVMRRVRAAAALALVRWGFIPSWAKDPRKYGPFVNARAEGILDKPAFHGAMRYRRCLVPATGWYHWEKGRDGDRRPWLIRPRAGGVVLLAGLWDPWLGADGSEVDGALIVTVPSGADVEGVADRMPAVLPSEAASRWADVDRVPADAAAGLLRLGREGGFEAVPVSMRVNHIENDDAGLMTHDGG